ncbi:MAG: TrkA family potassium uptake protein [Oscillospiraceae bacterium]|jgi:trk system potassium uptake protein TrkA|nr:TrkA family potassium uptake protein [Oscillospiraceae bacterium]
MASNKRADSEYTVVVGCGRLGANIANSLSDAGASVLVIDIDKNSARLLSNSFAGGIMTRDATELSALEEAQLRDADSVIVVTNNDNINIMVAQMAKELYGVERVIARLYDPERETVYSEFGIQTISPILLSMQEVNKMLGFSKSEGAE